MSIHILTGHLGSGKTEVAINLAVYLAERARCSPASDAAVALLDIDVVNPYFAAREARSFLESQGILVAAPSLKTTTAALPTLPSEVYQLLHRKDLQIIIDVGGDSTGARLLKSLQKYLEGEPLQVYGVVNTKRPSTARKQDILAYLRDIRHASGLAHTALIHNTHLLDETSPEDVHEGQTIIENVALECGLPIAFTAVMKELALQFRINNAILAMERHIKPPFVVNSH